MDVEIGQIKLASRGDVPEPPRNECTGKDVSVRVQRSTVLPTEQTMVNMNMNTANSQWQPSKAVERSVTSACGLAPRQPKTSLNGGVSVTSKLCCAALRWRLFLTRT